MYLTKITGIVGDVYHTHRVVKDLFSSEERPLYKNFNGKVHVLSVNKSDKDSAFDGSFIDSVSTVDVPSNGTDVEVKIKFNPTKNVRIDGKPSRKVGIGDPSNAKEWLIRRLESNGVSVIDITVNPLGIEIIEKNGKRKSTIVGHQACGIITINDSESFANLLRTGVGGGKFAGYGMINVW